MANLYDPITTPSAVRAAVDTSLTEEMLPDDIIMQDVYVGVADRLVRSIDPDADTRTGANLQRLITAVSLFTAAYLYPHVPRIIQEQFGTTYRYEMQRMSVADMIQELNSRAFYELSMVVDNPFLGYFPTMFTRAPGCRGQG